MSATNQMRAILDELMGTTRDGNRPSTEFDDYRVCKCFFFDCCPHDVLAGTRMDLGECDSIHDPALKADYFHSKRRKEYNFEKEVYRNLEKFISGIDKKVQMAIRSLQETQEELPDGAGEIAEDIHKLSEQIGTKLVEAEKYGADGKVEESLKLMGEVEDLNKKKNAAETNLRNAIPPHQYQQQKLRVCEICSAYLGIQDNDRRLADHFGGKLHLGFIILREKLIEIEKLANDRSESNTKNSPDMTTRTKNRSKSKEESSKRRSKSKSKDRSSKQNKSKSKERSRKNRSRSKNHRRSESRSKDRKKHSGSTRSKDHNKKSRRSRSRTSKDHKSHRKSRSSSKRSERHRH